MNLWFNKRDGNYAAGGGGSWIRAYVDKIFGDLQEKYQRHAEAKADRHKADDVDYSDKLTVKAKLDDESSIRELSDYNLQARITQETSDREVADNALKANLNAEISSRQSADTDLQNRITDETAEREKLEQVYSVDISQVGSGNNILKITVPGVTSYDDLNNKIIRVYTGAYCNTNTIPANIYLNVNGLGNKAIRRPITSDKAGYDTKQYYTDLYNAREINRYTTMELSITGGSVTWLNPTPPCRATLQQLFNGTETAAYLTPDVVNYALRAKADKVGVIDITEEECPIQESTALDSIIPDEVGTYLMYDVEYSGKDSSGENIYRIARLTSTYAQIGGDGWYVQNYVDEYGRTYERRLSTDNKDGWSDWSSILQAEYITQNANYRFVSDAEKAKWNASEERISTVQNNIGNINELMIKDENSNTVVNSINEIVKFHEVSSSNYIMYEEEINYDEYLDNGWYTFNWFSDSYGDYESVYQNTETMWVKELNKRTTGNVTPRVILQLLYNSNGNLKYRFISDNGENINFGTWISLSNEETNDRISSLEARIAALEAPTVRLPLMFRSILKSYS